MQIQKLFRANAKEGSDFSITEIIARSPKTQTCCNTQQLELLWQNQSERQDDS